MTALPHLASDAVLGWRGILSAVDVDGETILMSIEHGHVFGLAAVGREVWRRLESPIGGGELCGALHDIYEGNPMVIERDVLHLLGRLSDEGLIEVGS